MQAKFGLTATLATAVLTLSCAPALAGGPAESADRRPPDCADLTHRQAQDLRLAAKAQEGEAAFVRHVHFLRHYRQWTMEEALQRAREAIRTPCAVALGYQPLDEARFPSLLARNP